MDLISQPRLGFGVAFTPHQPAVLPSSAAARHADRRAARHRPGRDHRDAAAGDLRAAAGVGADHAGRHLLRRAVRRLDHRDPGQPAGRVVVGGDRASTATRWRARAAPAPALAAAALGSFFAGCVGTLILAAFAPPLTELALKFGPAEYFSLMVLGLIGAVVLALGLAAQGDRDDRARPAARHGRHRRQLRRRALHASTSPS